MANIFKKYVEDFQETARMKKEIRNDLKEARRTLRCVKGAVSAASHEPLSKVTKSKLLIMTDMAMDDYNYIADEDSYFYLLVPCWVRVLFVMLSICASVALAFLLVYQAIVLLDPILTKLIESSDLMRFMRLVLLALVVFVISISFETLFAKIAEKICQKIAKKRVKTLKTLCLELSNCPVAND